MRRISVTDLEAWRYYIASEDASLEDLLARLRRETPPTAAMIAGRAFHAALETMGESESQFVEADGIQFHFKTDCELALPRVREMKGELEMQTSVGSVNLVGVVDGLNGMEVQDHKLTARWDAERYAESYQWRCYLTMFSGTRFVYNVFVGKEVKPNVYEIYDFHRLPLYAYPSMAPDVNREVDRFAQFLDRYLPIAPPLVGDANHVCTQA